MMVDLLADATYADRRARIDAVYGHMMPSQLWSSRFHCFASQIGVFPDGIRIDNPSAAVPREDDHFRFLTIMGGG